MGAFLAVDGDCGDAVSGGCAIIEWCFEGVR